MAASLRIRDAVVGDAADLAALLVELGYPTEVPVMRARLAALLDRSRRHIRVADDGTRVCGWIEAGRHLTLDADEHVEILTLVVADQLRHAGVGRQLVADIEDWARALHIGKLVVRSSVLRNASHPFYRHLGFQHDDAGREYVKRIAPGD